MWTWIARAKQFVLHALGREGKPTGKPQNLTPKAQERISTANLDRHAERLVALTQRWAKGQVDVARWQAGVREDLRQAYIQNYLLGIGGKGQLTKADYGSIGGMLREQLSHLKKFADELAAGKVSPAQAEARIRMYANSAREAHERGRAKAWGEAKEVLWIVHQDKEACEDCLALGTLGWQERSKLHTIPGAGATRCLTNCRCELRYR